MASDTGIMTEPVTDLTLRDLEQAAGQASDASAELLASLAALARSVRAAHAAGHPVKFLTRELRRGRAQARLRRAQNRIRPSARLAAHSTEVIAAAAASGLTGVMVFGSCVQGEANLGSDVDLLVSISERTSLLDLTRFAIAVEGLLSLDEGRADVVTGDALRPDAGRAGERIAAEAQPLAAWAAGWPRLDSLPGWVAARDAGASDEELADAAENGLASRRHADRPGRPRPRPRPGHQGARPLRSRPYRWAGSRRGAHARGHSGLIATTGVVRRAVTASSRTLKSSSIG